MQRLNYPLKHYIKAVEALVEESSGLSRVTWKETKGSIVRFDLFEEGRDDAPCEFWTIHYEHNDRKKPVWSKEDYRKAAARLRCTFEKFIETIETF